MVRRIVMLVWVMFIVLGLSVQVNAVGLSPNAGCEDVVKSFLANLGREIFSHKSLEIGGNIHLIYTVAYARNFETYYTFYDGERWASPVYVGGEYPYLFADSDGRVFVSSVIGRTPYLYMYDGVWHRLKISDGPATTSLIFKFRGHIYVAWREVHSVYIAELSGYSLKERKKIADEIGAVRSIEFKNGKIIVKEESPNHLITREFSFPNLREIWRNSVSKIILSTNNIPRTEPRQPAMWTYMVYLDGDNNLDSYGNDDVQQMMDGFDPNGDGKVYVVVLQDHDGSGDTELFYIDSQGKHQLSAPWLNSEENMGDPQTLIDFVTWTVQNYPAKYYMLDLWNHGGSYNGACWDDTDGSDNLNLPEIKYALKTIYETIGREIDCYGYDACLMAELAADYQVKQYVNYTLASEQVEGGAGWNYVNLINKLTTQPETTPEEYAYYHVNNADDNSLSTFSAVNNTRFDYYFIPAFNWFCQKLKHKAGTYSSVISSAWSNAQDYYGYHKDLGDFVQYIYNNINDPEIKNAAKWVLDNISIGTGCIVDAFGGCGIAETNDATDLGSNFYLVIETQYDEMLNANNDINNQEPLCQITSPTDGSSVPITAGTITVQGTASDPDGSVQKVQVKLDRGDWIDAAGTDSWSITLDISNLSIGTHYIFARSYDGTDFSWFQMVRIELIPRTDIPDLVIEDSDVQVSPSNPNEGDIVTITATVHNLGNNDSYNVNVTFYLDAIAPNNEIATLNAGDIPINGSAQVSYQWNTTGVVGEHTILALADSTHSIAELNERNNTGKVNITIYGYGVSAVCETNESYVRPNETTTYTVTVRNTGTYDDSYTIRTYGATDGWIAAVFPTYITLAPGEVSTVNLTVKAPENSTDGDKAIIFVEVVSSGNPSKMATVSTTTIVSTKIILLVDDDDGYNYESYFINALNDAGYSYDIWDVSNLGSPSADTLLRYKVVIWTTGDDYTSTLSSTDENNLIQFLENGGRLFLSSQDYLWDVSGGSDGSISNTFINNYLGVSEVNNDVSYTSVVGVSGDPIGDGLSLTLNYPYTNYADTITVGNGGAAIFTYNGQPTAVRLDGGKYRTVFLAFSFEAVENADSTTGAQLMDRIITWLLGGSAAGTTYTVQGYVYYPNGSPAINVSVYIAINDTVVTLTKTDSSGFYSVQISANAGDVLKVYVSIGNAYGENSTTLGNDTTVQLDIMMSGSISEIPAVWIVLFCIAVPTILINRRRR